LNINSHDSFVSIGCPGRPFATADPGIDDLLPTDDSAWDEGVGCPALRDIICAHDYARLSGQMIPLRCLPQILAT
jgi:hypothetical protein